MSATEIVIRSFTKNDTKPLLALLYKAYLALLPQTITQGYLLLIEFYGLDKLLLFFAVPVIFLARYLNNFILAMALVAALHMLYTILLVQMGKKNVTDKISKDEDLQDIVASYMSNEQRYHFWVATRASDGQIVGSIALRPYPYKKDDEAATTTTTCELKRVAVDTDMRRAGIASKLLNHALQFAKQQGYKRMVLSTSTIQQPAIAMYKKNGFALDKMTPMGVLMPVQVVYMSKDL